MTPAELRALFPEFTRATDALIQSRIDWATARTPADIWGDKRDQGIAWLAAHFLALAPGSEDMRKGEKPGETSYGRERKRLNVQVSSGFRTAGAVPETSE